MRRTHILAGVTIFATLLQLIAPHSSAPKTVDSCLVNEVGNHYRSKAATTVKNVCDFISADRQKQALPTRLSLSYIKTNRTLFTRSPSFAHALMPFALPPCKKGKNIPDNIPSPWTTGNSPQYGVPYSNVPAASDATIFQVNMRLLSPAGNLQGAMVHSGNTEWDISESYLLNNCIQRNNHSTISWIHEIEKIASQAVV